MKKRSIRLLLSALLVLVMAFQSFAAPLSYAGPTAASEPAKITGTWSTDASGSWRFNAPDGAAKDGWYYLNTTNDATDYNWFCFDANGVMRTGWVQDKNDLSVWYYTGETKDSSEGGLVKGWITDPQDGKKYYLDPSTGVMCHGWKQISGVWYYFGESRYADRKWAPDTTGYWKAGASGKHSYGSLYMNEWTPDGYYVGANGAWVQNHSEDDNSDKPDPAPETKKLSEILPSDFPTSADFAWVNADGKKAYKDGDNIKVGNLTLGKDTTATKSGDNYVCKSGDATVTFNVKDGAAESITVTGSSDSNGTYTAPETKKLSEILPSGFPETADFAWVNADGKKAYKDGENIKVGNLTLGKDTTATKSGDNYVCKSGDATVTFNVKDGAVESITVTDSDGSDGTYTAPETKKLSEILPAGFPTSAELAWVNGNDQKAYKDGENIKVGNLTLGKDVTVTRSGDNYVCKSGDATVTFNVKDGAVESITVTDSDGSDGTYTAPAVITFDENPFDPGNIKAGRTLTIKGKNLDAVTKVIFCNDVEATTFKSQSSEQIVIEKFPAKARTGKVTLVSGTTSQKITSDVDLVVAQPSVSEIYQFTGVKPNQWLTIEGENFDLVCDAIIGDDTYLDYIVLHEGHTIEIHMPGEVHDDTVKVIAYSGVEVTVADVTPATTHTVTFNLNGATGTAPTTQKIKDGEKVTKPTDPTFANHTFAGWYKTKDATTGALSDPWDFDNCTVTADMTLYAQWERTMESILSTNPGIPKVENLTPPSNAWANSTSPDCKAFVGIDGEGDTLFVVKKEGQGVKPFGLLMDDTFVRINENTYTYNDDYVTVIANMTDGKFTSCEWKFILSNYQFLDGTYTAPTFKAVYDKTGDANTLTFYYDSSDHSGEGITVYDNLPSAAAKDADWGYNSNRGNIKSVVIDASVASYKSLTSTMCMFHDMSNATNISGAEYLDVSNVTNMAAMFWKFGSKSSTLNSVPDVKDWNTVSVKNMQNMFTSYGAGSEGFNAVPDVGKWNTASVTNMTNMFWDFGSKSSTLNSVPDVKEWNTASVTNMNSMFESYGESSNNLNKVPDVSKWNTVSVTNMSDMFLKYGYTSTALNTVPDVSGWNTSSVTTMGNMFQNYGYSSTALSTVPNVSNWKTGKVTSMTNMFNGYGYTSNNISCVLDLSGWDLSIITSGDDVFNFKPKTFDVTIPAKTGEKSNEGEKWYYGDGTNSIAPPEGKTFTLAAPTISTIADVLATAGDNAPSATSHWYDTKGNYIYANDEKLLVHISAIGGDAQVNLDSTVTPNGDNYLYSQGVLSFTFNMTEGVLTSIHVNLSPYGVDGTFSPAPAVSTMLTLGVSGGQTHDAPMTEAEANVPFAEKYEPEFEPEKFEEAKPEELIEPAEAVAEEAAP